MLANYQTLIKPTDKLKYQVFGNSQKPKKTIDLKNMQRDATVDFIIGVDDMTNPAEIARMRFEVSKIYNAMSNWWISEDMLLLCELEYMNNPPNVQDFPHKSGFVVFKRPFVRPFTSEEQAALDDIDPTSPLQPVNSNLYGFEWIVNDERNEIDLRKFASLNDPDTNEVIFYNDSTFSMNKYDSIIDTFADARTQQMQVLSEYYSFVEDEIGTEIDPKLKKLNTEIAVETLRHDINFMHTVMLLMQQSTVAHTAIVSPSTKSAKKKNARRAKNTTSVDDIRVIDLNKPIHVSTNSEPNTESNRSLQHRFMVRGHWRNQPCGPGGKDRKLIYINPHIKGPDDAPFIKNRIYKI